MRIHETLQHENKRVKQNENWKENEYEYEMNMKMG